MRALVRALPTVVRVGFSEAVAYRAEMLIWILSTTMPLVMLVLWSAVAREQPVGRFGQTELSAYFLTTFCVRQLTGAWIGWQMNYEVRHGTLSMRLLRPMPPVLAWAIEHLAAVPLRLVVVVPVVGVMAAVVEPDLWPTDPWIWVFFAASLVGGWLINFVGQVAIGALSFFMQSSVKVIELWYVGFMVFSGYLFPLEMLPDGWRTLFDLLPFRFQLGLPVELATGAHDRHAALAALGIQWAWVAVFCGAGWAVWRWGLRRFAAYGG